MSLSLALESTRPQNPGKSNTSELFQRLLTDNGLTCSMSRSGNVWDNSAMESFFSSLKTERCHRKVYSTRDQARADVFDYVERFYNPRRRHSTLGYLSPGSSPWRMHDERSRTGGSTTTLNDRTARLATRRPKSMRRMFGEGQRGRITNRGLQAQTVLKRVSCHRPKAVSA
ncbi:MAG: transposase [Proteobacteria bacterium]|nr:transposase [Pseudomonadota bacterium]